MIRFVDLDGTLARFDVWKGWNHIGEPIPKMVQKVRGWIAKGDKVVVFTSRMANTNEYVPISSLNEAKKVIEEWCVKNVGQLLPVTGQKGTCDIIYDDLAVHVMKNRGETLEEHLLAQIAQCRSFSYNDSETLDTVVNCLKFNVDNS
jgi:hypothetical protein